MRISSVFRPILLILLVVASVTPLSQEWLDEHSEQVEIMTFLGARILNDLQYALRW